jgi:NadR type nicotinamide-nucleotide adenylyltransferase
MVVLHGRAEAHAGPELPLTRSRLARIVVTGSECTGKTTLARELAGALAVPWIPEYARDYAEARGGVLSAADVEAIARGQVAREDETIAGAAGSAPFIVLDTDLLSTAVYAEHYYGVCPPWILEEARRRLGDLYLLAATDIPWQADGVRDRPGARAELHERFVKRLHDQQAVTVPIDGLGPRRLENALAAVRGWRARGG